jgi:hypothetical protein
MARWMVVAPVVPPVCRSAGGSGAGLGRRAAERGRCAGGRGRGGRVPSTYGPVLPIAGEHHTDGPPAELCDVL